MISNVRELRERGGETEKITINLGYVDLGRIDLLVQEGFYSNRTDFIRTAIRSQLATHAPEVSRSIERQTLELGVRDFDAAELEQLKSEGTKLHIRVLGLVRFAADVTPELALETIASLTVLGAVQAQPALKSALAARTK